MSREERLIVRGVHDSVFYRNRVPSLDCVVGDGKKEKEEEKYVGDRLDYLRPCPFFFSSLPTGGDG